MRKEKIELVLAILAVIGGAGLAWGEEAVSPPAVPDLAKILVVTERDERLPQGMDLGLRDLMTSGERGPARWFKSESQVSGLNGLKPIGCTNSTNWEAEGVAANVGSVVHIRLTDHTIDRTKHSFRMLAKSTLYLRKPDGGWRKLGEDTLRAEGFGIHAGSASEVGDMIRQVEEKIADRLLPKLFPCKASSAKKDEAGGVYIPAHLENPGCTSVERFLLRVPLGGENYVDVWSEEGVPAGGEADLQFPLAAEQAGKAKTGKAQLVAVDFGGSDKRSERSKKDRPPRGNWRK